MDEYQKHARFYDPLVGPFLHSTYSDMVNILVYHGCKTLLDLCCGTGLFVNKAEKAGLFPTGVDLSPAMLKIARIKNPAINFLHNDASHVPMPGNSFDAVTLSFALHEKSRKTAFTIMKEAVRLVRKDGFIVVADYRIPVQRSSLFTRQAIHCVEWLAGRSHFTNFSDYMKRGGTTKFLEETGFNSSLQKTHLNGWAGIFVHRAYN